MFCFKVFRKYPKFGGPVCKIVCLLQHTGRLLRVTIVAVDPGREMPPSPTSGCEDKLLCIPPSALSSSSSPRALSPLFSRTRACRNPRLPLPPICRRSAPPRASPTLPEDPHGSAALPRRRNRRGALEDDGIDAVFPRSPPPVNAVKIIAPATISKRRHYL